MTEKIIEIRTRITETVCIPDYSNYERRLQYIELRGRILELRYNHNHDEKGRFCSGRGGGRFSSGNSAKSLDNSTESGYNMYRKTQNTGEFQVLPELMQKKYVNKIISDMNIDYSGIELDIIRDSELIGKNMYGYTFPDGKKVQLYPDAFSSRENLVKTIGHERIHCEQIKLFGKARDFAELTSYEKGAYFSEEYWWSEYKKRTGYNENG